MYIFKAAELSSKSFLICYLDSEDVQSVNDMGYYLYSWFEAQASYERPSILCKGVERHETE